ncbi:asparaginase [Zavarzinia compransoris]|uniref:Asparaginase n=1 Tax=Zavarzinia compransoris TaxID=1264899 RepID=A0A317E6T2_9PROT|nr:asparaginase [Zavarzinia compransoris]PWR21936.1 asparaginase [Zavarzinia compransoris]TDP47328.1 asparaginase [Zavarzinia compransoris]
MSAANPVLVEVLRGGIVESRHRGAYAVVDGDGRLAAAAGDIERPVFPRSSMKILQAVPLVESGAADRFACTAAELALACASHNGEEAHVATAAGLLARLGLGEGDLACGAHAPSHGPAAKALAARGEAPCRLHNNCSGKHAGFLTVARHLGAPVAGYEQRRHPVQQAVFEAVAGLAGQAADLPYGIDGCAAPNPALPLHGLALAMARIAAPAGLAPGRAAAVTRLRQAMAAHPFLVAGSGRACTRLMQAARPGTVVKVGAEGVFIAIAPDPGLGFALKIDDGGTRAAEVLIARLLDRFGLIRDDARATVADLLTTPLANWGGTPVGEIRIAPDWT